MTLEYRLVSVARLVGGLTPLLDWPYNEGYSEYSGLWTVDRGPGTVFCSVGRRFIRVIGVQICEFSLSQKDCVTLECKECGMMSGINAE